MTEPEITEPDTVQTEPPVVKQRRITWLTLTIAAVFGLVFANFVYQAIRNLIELPRVYELLETTSPVPWALLIVGLAVPIVLYALAFIIGFRRRYLDQIAVFAMALTVTAGFGFTVVAIHRLTLGG
jgi:hypothetical protein